MESKKVGKIFFVERMREESAAHSRRTGRTGQVEEKKWEGQDRWMTEGGKDRTGWSKDRSC